MRWGIIIASLVLASCNQATDAQLKDIQNKVAADAEAQYELTDKHGSAIDKCVQAGVVSAAYLQAKNEEKYRYWKVIERLNCVEAGMPQ